MTRLAGFTPLSLLLTLCIATAVSALNPPSKVASQANDIGIRHLNSIRCVQPGTDFAFSPLGVCFGAVGELYLVDSDNSEIYVLPDSLTRIAPFAACPDEYGSCQFMDVETDASAGLYVSERGSGTIMVFDTRGSLVSRSDVGEGITGIGDGRSGEIYSAMSTAGTIRVADPLGEGEALEFEIADTGDAYPLDCLVDGTGNLIVTEPFSRQVLILGPLGDVRDRFRGFDFDEPFGVAAYGNSFILISDAEAGLVAVFTSDGRFVRSFGEGVLDTPTFLACRDDGVVCVADSDGMTVEVFRIDDPASK
jgi:hypothetical protein